MKKNLLLKIFALTTCLALMPTYLKAYAWGGYAHWEMSNRASSNLTSEQKLNYTSATVIADLGKLNWDKNYTSSDSEKFTNKMIEISKKSNTLSDIYFAKGWMSHYIQDNIGSLNNISGGPSSYRIKCGWVDEYLRDNKKVSTPINGKSQLSVNYNIIRNTYSELDNFTPTNSQIDSEIKATFLAYDLQILSNLRGWTSSDKANIEKELNRTSDLCNLNSTIYSRHSNTNEFNLYSTGLSDSKVQIVNTLLKEAISDLESNNSIDYSSSPILASNSNMVEYNISNHSYYNQILEELYTKLDAMGIVIYDILN